MFAWWGHAVVRWRWLVLAAAAGMLALGVTWGGGVFNDLTSGGFTDPGSESTRAQEQITELLGPQQADVLALYTADDEAQLHGAVAGVVQQLEGQPEVATVTNGIVSTDGSATYLAIQLSEGSEDSKLSGLATIEPLLQAATPVQTQIGGLIPFLADANEQVSNDIVQAELISLPILLILLVLIFRGVIAATTPLLVGIMAVLGAMVSVRLIAQVTEVSVFAVNIITMLGLGMAIDYALFVVSRFREELAAGRDPAAAIAVTLQTAGRTVLVSALTVAVALASLLIFPMGFLKSMAWGGMAAVLVAMLAALTVLPALLAVLGPRIDALRVPLPGLRRAGNDKAGGGWARLAGSVMRRPVIYAVGVTALLLALATPFLRVEFGGFDERVLPEGTESRVVTERLGAEFEGGSAAPINVLVQGSGAARLQADIEDIGGVTGSQLVAQRDGTSLLAVSYAGEPANQQARDVVQAIRALPAPGGTEMLVGGRPAVDADMLDALADRLPWMLAMVAVSTFLLLFLAFGSVVLPVKAIAMNMVSLGASFGVVVWIFQDGHLAEWLGFTVTGFLEPTNLVLMLAVLFGLATDYEVFLLSRVREVWDRTGENTTAVTHGLRRTGGIITAAAILLMVVVAGFATGGTVTVKVLGIGTLMALAVDAFLVRALLVPATMRLLGRWNWWAPGPLARLYRRYGIRES